MKNLRGMIGAAVSARLSPEYTRSATMFEQYTVQRLAWHQLTRLNRWLEFTGKVTTALWVAFVATVVLGFDWRDTVESALNSGRPIQSAIVLVLVVPTLLFVAARSMIGFARWRLQRELWRRDVRRLTGEPES